MFNSYVKWLESYPNLGIRYTVDGADGKGTRPLSGWLRVAKIQPRWKKHIPVFMMGVWKTHMILVKMWKNTKSSGGIWEISEISLSISLIKWQKISEICPVALLIAMLHALWFSRTVTVALVGTYIITGRRSRKIWWNLI